MTNEGSCIVYITEKHARQDAQNATFGQFADASLFSLTRNYIFVNSSWFDRLDSYPFSVFVIIYLRLFELEY